MDQEFDEASAKSDGTARSECGHVQAGGQMIEKPFRYWEVKRPSIFADDKKNANQYTAGRKVNLAPMPASSFCTLIPTRAEQDRTNSIKGRK